jgi:hypothetical protein
LVDSLARHPGLHCHRQMAVPPGNQKRGTIDNVVMIAISIIFIYVLTLDMQNL